MLQKNTFLKTLQQKNDPVSLESLPSIRRLNLLILSRILGVKGGLSQFISG